MSDELRDLGALFDAYNIAVTSTYTDLVTSNTMKWDPEKRLFYCKDVETKIIHSDEDSSVMVSTWSHAVMFPRHCHTVTEILHFTKGTFAVILDGKYHHLGPGETLIIPPNTMHMTTGLLPGSQLISVNLPRDKAFVPFGRIVQ